MNPNPDLMRKILIAADSGVPLPEIEGLTLEELACNVEFCIEAGFATGVVTRTAGLAYDLAITKVLWPGHQFIKSATKSPELWNKFKEEFIRVAPKVSVAALVAVAKAWLAKLLPGEPPQHP